MKTPEQPNVGPDSKVTLREITSDTVRPICNLSKTLSETHQKMVAPNAISIAEAYFEKCAWFRAIYADDEPVGFVMLHENTGKEEYFLWRMMIAGKFHGMGFGKKAMLQIIERVKSRPGAKELLTSCVPGEGSPEGFYLNLGFTNTGKWDEGEMLLRLEL
ncbi:MAG: GNAT family N-acetyltransferase [bacterium]|nr:GNAT family N-acetyltransferase [bacterium]